EPSVGEEPVLVQVLLRTRSAILSQQVQGCVDGVHDVLERVGLRADARQCGVTASTQTLGRLEEADGAAGLCDNLPLFESVHVQAADGECQEPSGVERELARLED